MHSHLFVVVEPMMRRHDLRDAVEGRDYAAHLDANFGDREPFPHAYPEEMFTTLLENV